MNWPWIKNAQQTQQAVNASPNFATGTHAERLATDASTYPDGTLFVETDRSSTYVVYNSAWQFYFGLFDCLQANLPTDLSTEDGGFLAFITDYLHLLQWTGSAWRWGPGESGSGEVSAFLANPGTGWALCNGSTVDQMNPDGTITAVALPDYSTPALLVLAAALNVGPTAGTVTSPGTFAATTTQLLAYFRL